MRRTFVLLWIFLAMMFAPTVSLGQMNRRAIKKNNKKISSYAGKRSTFSKRYNFVGLSVNSLNYFGDLSPLPSHVSTDLSSTRPGVGFSAARRFGPRYTLQTQFLYGTIRGSDAESANPMDREGHARYLRNLSFRNHIKELSVVAHFDLFANQVTYTGRPLVAPYAYFGMALLLHNPKAQIPQTDLEGKQLPAAGDWVSLRSLGTEGQYSKLNRTDANFGIRPYSVLIVAIPVGVGSRFKLTELLDLWIEIGVRYTFTDYLDDVSKNYIDLGVLSSPLARAMSYRTPEVSSPNDPITYQGRDQLFYTVQNGYGQEQPSNIRGNERANDLYMVTSIRVTRIIPPSFQRAKQR